MRMRTAKRFCARIVLASLLICGSIPAALADGQPAYDRRIEEAAIRMLQPKLGEIRGSLNLETEDHLYPPLSERIFSREEAGLPATLPPGVSQGSFIRY